MNQEPKSFYEPIGKQSFVINELGVETRKAYDLITVTVKPGGGIALHYHKEVTETFKCIKGTVGLQVENETIFLKVGEIKEVLPKMQHRFFNDSKEEAIFEVKITPSGSKIIDFLIVIFGLVRDGKTTKTYIPYNIFYTGIIVEWADSHTNDLKYRFFYKLRKIFSYIAEKFKLDNKLLNRYK